jgi:uncharacterized membrane protein
VVNQILIDVFGYGHVLSAIGWLGGGILTAFVLGPNLRKLTPPAALEFNAKVLPKVVSFIQGAIGSTLVFGLLLVYFFNDGDLSWLTNTTQGYEISAGMALALVTAGFAMGFVLPSFKKLATMAKEALDSGQAPPPDMMKYAKRARLGSITGVVLLLVVLGAMVASGFS